MANITCFGEVLWDVFPTHKKIGGAPLNVAVRLQSFGNNVSMVSRVGEDEKGAEILDFFKTRGVNTEGVQIDSVNKTGKVKVVLDEEGSASYDIMFPRAWDKIELSNQAKTIVSNSDAFVFGSLAARDDISRETLYELLKLAKYKIFDVNLRPPYYTVEVLKYLMSQADFVKFNDDEIIEIAKELGFISQSLEEIIQFVSKETAAKTICVTKGGSGAILYVNNTFYYNGGYKVKVVDTVGAGDSFLASIITQLLNKNAPQEALNFACAVGAIVASSEGANPEIKKDAIEKMINS
ncbi:MULTISPECIES: carbohydrate kinase [unclassified Algibacter]|uniref:carbohydrate kinase family protein n=1 Tax=unclassified Algibacter TaxID=2615009 RepID=UPI00131BCF9A|nr:MULTISPECIES: carbohydrate kinase [unclassified Algibacter]MCL5129508.1 carbohydrate kinase [Algibacter sp. L4_22]